MKRWILLIALSFPLAVLSQPLSAEGIQPYGLTDRSRIQFEASTPLFAFTGRVRTVEGILDFAVEPPEVRESTSLSVRVESITTGISARDRDLYELLQTDTFPRITFRADSVTRIERSPAEILREPGSRKRSSPRTPMSGGDAAGDGSDAWRTVMVHGDFTIMGTTRSVHVPVVVTADTGTVRLQSRFQLDVRDFGIEPPSLYVMSVNPTVTVTVDLRAKPVVRDAPRGD